MSNEQTVNGPVEKLANSINEMETDLRELRLSNDSLRKELYQRDAVIANLRRDVEFFREIIEVFVKVEQER